MNLEASQAFFQLESTGLDAHETKCMSHFNHVIQAMNFMVTFQCMKSRI